MTRAITMSLTLCVALFALACGEKDGHDTAHEHDDTAAADDTAATDDSAADDSSEPEGIAIAGSYTDSWGGTHEVSDARWDQGFGGYAISQFDNAAGFAVAQNDASNEYNPELWSRFNWAWSGEQLFYCQIAYDAATEGDAAANETADAGDLAAGCNGFGWTELIAN